MDSPKFNPTWTLESPQVPDEGYSGDTQVVSEVLAKNLRNLTLNPGIKLSPLPPESSPKKQERGSQGLGLSVGPGPSRLILRRRGVRTVASVRKLRMRRMLQEVRLRTMSLLKKSPEERKLEIEERTRKFRCSCRYCLDHGDPSDDIYLENNFDMESM